MPFAEVTAAQDPSWSDFVMSAGFGGLAAVVAASIAYLGVRKTVSVRRAADRKQQWWERARWALDLTLNENPRRREVGHNVVAALATSEYAAEHEDDLIVAAVGGTLAVYHSQGRRVDAGGDKSDEADLRSDDTSGGAHDCQ